MQLKIAIVGTGPGAFYAADSLIRRDGNVTIDLFERLPTPYGLVRSGVAPDHQKIKTVQAIFADIAHRDQVTFHGNVDVGRDVSLDDLLRHYHCVIVASGASRPQPLGVPGEHLFGAHSAVDFVGWYNGSPDHRNESFDFSGEHATVVGHGNVALDVCRILATPVEHLARSDMAQHALEALGRSRLRTISLVGRRGPAQAKFTAAELKALGAIEGLDIEIRGLEAGLNAASQAELDHSASGNARKNIDILRGFAARPRNAANKLLIIRFLEAPVVVLGIGRVERLRLRQNVLVGESFAQEAQPIGAGEEEPCDLLLYSTGFRGVPLSGAPFNEASGVIPNIEGRAVAEGGVVDGLYVAGWIKRGATGTIGTNRADSDATVDAILADRAQLAVRATEPRHELLEALHRRTEVIDFAAWLRIDAAEILAGTPFGKPREKFTQVLEMLEHARSKVHS